MAQETLPLHLKAIVKALICRHLDPVIVEVVIERLVRIPDRARRVNTALHFTVVQTRERATVRPINLAAEDAMKMEFSAGLFQPKRGWLTPIAPSIS